MIKQSNFKLLKREQKYFDELFLRYPYLDGIKGDILAAYRLLADCYEGGGKVLIAGNGGSSADAAHIVGELMKGFKKERKLDQTAADRLSSVDPEKGALLARVLQGALPAIDLCNHTALNTAFSNDVDAVYGFAQQALGYGKEGDVFLAISTSGNSENIFYAALAAKAAGMYVIGLTGGKESRLSKLADAAVRVPEEETFKVQELHLPIYHCLCLMLEERFFE